MHELAQCLVLGPTGAKTTGFVERFDEGVLRVRLTNPPEGFAAGQSVELRVLDEVRGEVRYGGSVERTDDESIELVGLDQYSVRQRRGAARARVDVRCSALVTHPGTGEQTDLVVSVLDISATGARLLVTDRLPDGAEVSFDFPTKETVLPIVARVVWSEESVSGWRHGCRFISSSPRDTELLFRFVLLTQGEQRRHVRERAASAG